MNELVFALDIGTQSVTGILLKKNGKFFDIVDFYVKHHEERAMLDGQIQNVIQVAEIITEVKERLEEKHGPLQKACVAAAGRALKTVQSDITIPISERPITGADEVKHLELGAVQQAQLLLSEEKNNHFKDYHCVGYSVVHYKLDGEIIGSVIDQVGEEVSVEIIATFLPKVVVESLLAALERAHLQMEALTLEPIAAIHVLIPESMRRLNVALIDIGAGTSDIAISNHGTVIAYGMVPIAGDEITEKISDHFLLDFKEAEEIKQKIVNEKSASVQDILGFDVTITYDELVNVIDESVDHLAQLLADKVQTLNTQSPQAVMLIGGGSLTPMINEKLANYLQLPINRVAVRGTEAIQSIENNDLLPSGPEFVTPVGIAISASENPFQYINVFVNDKVTFMFATSELTVGDCLIQAGIDVNQYYGKIGLALFITLNGETLTIPGTYGTAPKMLVNGKDATVETSVKPNDSVIITAGTDGESPVVPLKEITGELPSLTCYFNDAEIEIQPIYLVNNRVITPDYIVQDKDEITTKIPNRLIDILNAVGEETIENQPFFFYVNGRQIEMNSGSKQLLVNGETAEIETIIHEGDRVEIVHAEKIIIENVLEKLDKNYWTTIDVTFNGSSVTLKQQLLEVSRAKEVLDLEDEVFPEDELIFKELNQRSFIFQDIFRFIDIDLSKIAGNYQIFRNEEPISFHDQIMQGDFLEIKSV